MKKLLVIALALFTMNGMAQEKDKRSKKREAMKELMKEMTPKDIADLKAKKMTLHLDLTEAQQNKVHKIILAQAEKNQELRKVRATSDDGKKEKPSKDEFIKMQNNRLDQQIELKREMKSILTAEQYTKFEKMKPRKHKRKGKRKRKAQKRDE